MSDASYAGPINKWLAQAPPAPPPQQSWGKSLASLLAPYLRDSDQAQAAAEAAAGRVRAPYAAANERTSGLPEVAGYFGNRLASALTAPRDAFTGAMQVNDPATGMPTPEAMQRGQGVANMAMTGGMPFAQRGTAGIFGGRLAKTADQAAADEAASMLKSGASKEDIWNKTGWFQGADDKWRFEIPDTGEFRLKAPLPERGSEAWLDKTVDAPLSAAAYPSTFGGAEIARGDLGRGMWQHGNVTDEGVVIPHRLTVGSGADRGTLLHEFQHGIQRTEDFAPGANALALKPGTPAWDIYQERLRAMQTPLSHEEFSKQANYEGPAPQKDYKDYLKTTKNPPPMADRAAQEYAVKEAYRRSAGEVEARNVQKRMNMTPEERRAAPPWTTEDVPREQQIVRGATSGPQMSLGKLGGAAPSKDSNPVPVQFRDIKLNTPSGKTDTTGVWFVHGDKPTYASSNLEGARGILGDTAEELNKFPSVTGKNANGNPITVWHKPGEEGRAQAAVDNFKSAPVGGTVSDQIKYHLANADAYGYPREAAESYVRGRFGDKEVDRLRKPSSGDMPLKGSR